MEKQHKILAISGSLRSKSYNKALLNEAKHLQILDLDIFDISGIPDYNEDFETEELLPEPVRLFRESIKSHKGILITTPEYNWSIPGVLKNAIDWLSTNKCDMVNSTPIAVTGVTTGGFGTVRAQMHLKNILFHLNAKVMNRPDLFISQAEKVFDEQGNLQDENTKKRLEQFLISFKTFTQ